MTVKVSDIAFVRFGAPDIDEMEAFLTDFGLHRAARDATTLYMRGASDDGFVHVTHQAGEPGFIGLAFEVADESELTALSQMPAFGAVGDLDGPCEGRVVRAIDPNGFSVEVVADRNSLGKLATPASATVNGAASRPRRGTPVRLDRGPSHVQRLGHCVLNVIDFRTSEAWYKDHLGFVTSDEVALDEHNALGAFLRCNQGEKYVDHHTLFLIGVGRAQFNHAAFEVADFDDLMRGHSYLTERQRVAQWGIGRHLLGSQIYDYWLDPHGQMLEHWTDGDLFNHETPPNIANIDELLASQWGPTHGHPPI